jgi:predicted aspartyl protease
VRSLSIHVFAVLTTAAMPVWADCPATGVTIPLSLDARPTIAASIDGNPVRMIVDTGAETSSVTPDTVARLGLARDPNRRTLSTTVGGREVNRNAILDGLRIADFDYSNLSVAVLSLDGMRAEPRPAGLIGADLLGFFDVDLDFPGRTLTLYPAVGCSLAAPPWTAPYATIPARVSDHRQFLFPVELNGHPLNAVFDTGSRGETLSRAAAESIGIAEAQLDNDTPGAGTSGGLHPYAISRHRFDTFRIGAETFRNVPLDVVDFHQPGIDLLIGVDYMHARRFFLSYSTATLFIQRPPRRADPRPAP